jgi:hypothetical protein
MMDTLESFHIYNITKENIQINDRNAVTQNILFDAVLQQTTSRWRPEKPSLARMCPLVSVAIKRSASAEAVGYNTTNLQSCKLHKQPKFSHYKYTVNVVQFCFYTFLQVI